ncbi:MAG: TOBE domain-containing protein, partial [Thermoproteota archaeon]
LRNGTVIEALSNEGFKRGELAVAAVRCEDIGVGGGPLTARLKEVNFLGSFSKLVFELTGGLKITVNIPLPRFIKEEFRIGASFQLSIPREKTYLFKQPPMGLMGEIEAV